MDSYQFTDTELFNELRQARALYDAARASRLTTPREFAVPDPIRMLLLNLGLLVEFRKGCIQITFTNYEE